MSLRIACAVLISLAGPASAGDTPSVQEIVDKLRPAPVAGYSLQMRGVVVEGAAAQPAGGTRAPGPHTGAEHIPLKTFLSPSALGARRYQQRCKCRVKRPPDRNDRLAARIAFATAQPWFQINDASSRRQPQAVEQRAWRDQRIMAARGALEFPKVAGAKVLDASGVKRHHRPSGVADLFFDA